MKKLVAKIPILYQGRMYEVGEALPAYDEKMTDAWLRAKSAELIDTAKLGDPPADDQGTPGNDQNPSGNDQNPQGGEDTAKLMEGHLDPAQLSKLNKPDLEALAKQLGVDIPRGATKDLIVEKISVAAVQASEGEGAAQE